MREDRRRKWEEESDEEEWKVLRLPSAKASRSANEYVAEGTEVRTGSGSVPKAAV